MQKSLLAKALTLGSKIVAKDRWSSSSDLREDTKKVVPGRSQIFAKTRPHGFSKYRSPRCWSSQRRVDAKRDTGEAAE